jgi:ORF6N domain
MPRRVSSIDRPTENIGQFILVLRRHRVLLDQDLAELYGVQTRVLVQAVKRNLSRFPGDFMFQLTAAEWAALRSQTVILKPGRGQHRKYLPYAFTEQGVAMLSSVLNSERAITVNIEIMRAFVRIRELLASDNALALKYYANKTLITLLFFAVIIPMEAAFCTPRRVCNFRAPLGRFRRIFLATY